jgi:hypothetical protein
MSMFTFPRAGPSLTTSAKTPGELYVKNCFGQVFSGLSSRHRPSTHSMRAGTQHITPSMNLKRYDDIIMLYDLKA